MHSARFSYKLDELSLGPDNIKRAMGYTPESTPELISDITDECLDFARINSTIRAEYRIFEEFGLDIRNGYVLISKEKLRIGKIISSQLRGSEMAALFVGTAGSELGELSSKYMSEGDLLKGYIMDVVGSELVESAINKMQKGLADYALSIGKSITNRFSPGYCGWDVAEQYILFGLMPDNYCNITLTDSALMNPVKSVSGLIGIGEEACFQPYTCNKCDSQNCIYRGRK